MLMMRTCRNVVLALLAIVLLGLATPTALQAEPASPLEIRASAGNLTLKWRLPPGSFANPDAQLTLPEVEIGSVRLPAKLVAIHLPDGLPAAPQIDRVESLPWHGAVHDVDSLIPQTISGVRRPARATPKSTTQTH
jgi:hypothetical protein